MATVPTATERQIGVHRVDAILPVLAASLEPKSNEN
jgi:hypothetical protein